MPTMVLAAAQLGPADEDKARNVERILALLRQASDKGVRLLTLPELSLTPYFCLDPEPAETNGDAVGSQHVQRITRTAGELGLNLVLPLAEQFAGACYNAAVLIDEAGAVRGRQHKVHLPTAEQRHFSAGREFVVNELAGRRVGVVICADRGFPESWRVLGVLGAEVVCAPYNTSQLQAHGCPPDVPEVDWARDLQATRMRAAAMANGYFVVAAGKGGRERGVDYIADSMVISPWGQILGRARTEGDELVAVEVDLAEVERFRAGGRYQRRVPSAYAPITAPLSTASSARSPS